MKWDVLFQNILVTSEASCTNVVEVNVLVALGSTFDEEAELVKEIVVLDPDSTLNKQSNGFGVAIHNCINKCWK